MYLYADTNAIPGLVLVIIAGMVLAFIVFGKLMEVSGRDAVLHRSRHGDDGAPPRRSGKGGGGRLQPVRQHQQLAGRQHHVDRAW